MPGPLLDAHVRMLPVLKARENLLQLEIASMASGNISPDHKDDVKDRITEWQHDANMFDQEPTKKTKASAWMRQQMAQNVGFQADVGGAAFDPFGVTKQKEPA